MQGDARRHLRVFDVRCGYVRDGIATEALRRLLGETAFAAPHATEEQNQG
jgi:hypothetical protein